MKPRLRLAIGAALAVLGTAAAIPAGASRPVHQAPDVKNLVVYDRADGTVLVVAGVAHSTRSTAAARADTGHAKVSLSRRGGIVVARAEKRVLHGVHSRGLPVQYRALLSPRKAAALGLRASGAPRRVLVRLTVEHRSGRRSVSEARISQPVRVRRVKRRRPSALGAAVYGGTVQVNTSHGFPPDPLRFGRPWRGLPPTVLIDWTWDAPYEPYVSSIVYDKDYCLLQPSYAIYAKPGNGFINVDGTFAMSPSPGTCGQQGSRYAGRLNPVMSSDGSVPAGATMSLNWNYYTNPSLPPTSGSAILPILPK